MSGIQAEARLEQLKEDQHDIFALLYKQEFVKALNLRVSPQGCISAADLKADQSYTVPRTALTLSDLFKQLSGRRPGLNEIAIIQFRIKYGAIHLVLIGQASAIKERWFYSAISNQLHPGSPVPAVGPIPASQENRTDLIDLQLSDSDMKRFMPNVPSIQSVIQEFGLMFGQFSPRLEMGFFRVDRAGFYVGAHSVDRLPPQNVTESSGWTGIEVPIDYLRCWDVSMSVNSRMIWNVVKSDGYFPEVTKRLMNWPQPIMISEELGKGSVWLAPSPSDWKELRPLMNCRVAWLLCGETESPCPQPQP